MFFLWWMLTAALFLVASLLVAWRLRAINELKGLMDSSGIQPNPLQLGDLLAIRLLKYRGSVSPRERALIQQFAAAWMMFHILLGILLVLAFVVGFD